MVRKFKTEKGQLVYVVPISRENNSDTYSEIMAIEEVARFKKEKVKGRHHEFWAEFGWIAPYKDGLDGVWLEKDIPANAKIYRQPCVMVCAASKAYSIFKA